MWMQPVTRILSLGIVISFVVTTAGYAQPEKADSSNKAHNTIYVEMVGSGIVGSLNYERRILSNRLALRGGIYYITMFSVGFATIPFTASVLFRLGNTDFFAELGGGLTFIVVEDKDTDLVGTTIIGVRYQPDNGGLFTRLALMPTTFEKTKLYHLGIAFGYSF